MGRARRPLPARARADLRAVGEQVLARLAGAPGPGVRSATTLSGTEGAGPAVIVAQDLTPAQVAALDTSLVAGVVCAAGGPTSHAAILARALGVPAVVAAGPPRPPHPRRHESGAGRRRRHARASSPTTPRWPRRSGSAPRRQPGRRPPAPPRRPAGRDEGRRDGRRRGQHRRRARRGRRRRGRRRRRRPVAHGVPVPRRADAARRRRAGDRVRRRRCGARRPPPHHPHARRRRRQAACRPPVRTRGRTPSWACAACASGWRTPRSCCDQLRAVLRAAARAPVRVMFPMVTTVDELRRARALLDEAREFAAARGVDVPDRIETGIMLEVPSAALDRRQPRASGGLLLGGHQRPDPVHAGRRARQRRRGEPVRPAAPGRAPPDRHDRRGGGAGGGGSRCAASSRATSRRCPSSLGLGVRELSVTPAAVATVKQAVRETTRQRRADSPPRR